jgi:hypothetical protein
MPRKLLRSVSPIFLSSGMRGIGAEVPPRQGQVDLLLAQVVADGDGRHRGTDGSSRWVGIGDEDVGGASGPPVPKGQQCPTVGCAPAPL